MPFLVSSSTLKQQAKSIVKHWPRGQIKTTKARMLLCQLYGYKDDHHFKQLVLQDKGSLLPLVLGNLTSHYPYLVKRLAELGGINEIQSKKLIHSVWSAYLSEEQALSGKMYKCGFQFYGECRDFFAVHGEELEKSASWIVEFEFDDKPSVKDVIESIGIPHPEIAAIKINGAEVGFDYSIVDKDKIEVYSHAGLEGSLPFMPTGESKFILDVHLGGLARYLRMAGFDCLFDAKDQGDENLAELSSKEKRILLTRDLGLLKRSIVDYGRWVRNTDSLQQFKEVVQLYGLKNAFSPFTRCIKCNGSIEYVRKDDVRLLVPRDVYSWQEEFRQCGSCSQVYWKGTHFDKMEKVLADALRKE